MSIAKSIAANVNIKSVEYIEYYYRSETNELNQVTHFVTLKLNRHVYVGRYSGSTEADAFLMAQDVVKGCLIKSGCFNPDVRLPNVPFKKYNFPAPPPLTDPTPTPTPNWSNITHQSGGIHVNSGQQITGISLPIDLYLSYARLAGPDDQPWLKVTSTYNANDATQFPDYSNGWTMIPQNTLFTVTNNQWVWFGTRTTDTNARTLTVNNASDNNTVLDTFTQVYIPPAASISED